MKIPDFKAIKTLIFDLDGVITSESKYWNAARLTVWELITSPQYLGVTEYFQAVVEPDRVLDELGQTIVANSFIFQLKRRAVNSNWDLTFFVFCLHLAGILSQYRREAGNLDWSILSGNRDIQVKLNALGLQLQGNRFDLQLTEAEIACFWQETQLLVGVEVLDRAALFLQRQLGTSLTDLAPKGELWQLCYRNFQAWYEGRKGYSLPDDETVADLTSISQTLARLSPHYTLAIATGRPRNEVIEPFQKMGLLNYFDPQRIVTYDDVLEAESLFAEPGIHLGKPHPFIIHKAACPNREIGKLCADNFQLNNPQAIAYIGDAGSDVVAATRAGCLFIGVLTGFSQDSAKTEKRELLKSLGCNILLDSILELPHSLGV